MAHPGRITELVLRGVFTCRQQEVDWFYKGPGVNYMFPEDWSDFEEAIPEVERGDLLGAYQRRLAGELGEEGQWFDSQQGQ